MAGPGTGCLAHPILEHHDKEVEVLLKYAQDPIQRPGRSNDWRKDDFCKLWLTPKVWEPYSVEKAEKRFIKEFPGFGSSLTKFPPGPIYDDKLAKKEPTTRARDLEEKHKGKLLRDWPGSDQGNYNVRTGEMGEVITARAITKEIQNQTELQMQPSHPSMNIQGFPLKYALKNQLNPETDLQFKYGKGKKIAQPTPVIQSEHDLVTFIPNDDKIEVVFSQVKTSNKFTDDVLKKKITDALEQTRRDLDSFLQLLPDIGATEVRNFDFKTLAIFPETDRPSSLCSDCDQKLIFRSDIRWVTRRRRRACSCNRLKCLRTSNVAKPNVG